MPAAMRSSSAVLLALVAFAPACSKDPPPAPAATPTQATAAAAGLPDRDPALAHKLVAGGALLIDVRTPEEYAGRHLDGAVNIPVDQLQSRMSEVDKLAGGDKNKPIVVYCQAGGRAGRAKGMLVESGHGQVTNLGGIGDWDKDKK
jgi:phage shock protein E